MTARKKIILIVAGTTIAAWGIYWYFFIFKAPGLTKADRERLKNTTISVAP